MDWIASLSPASLAGLSFHVRDDEIEAGRRHAVHTIPNGGHVVEEFGAQPRTYDVTAYCGGGPASAASAARLLDLDRRHGPHLLVLPTASAMVVIDRIRRAFERDRLGYIAVDITCVDAGDVAAPGFGLAAGAALTAASLDNLVFAAADALFDGLGADAAALVGAVSADLAEAVIGSALDVLVQIETVREATAASALVEAAHGVGVDALPSVEASARAEARAAAAAEFALAAATLEAQAGAAMGAVATPAVWTSATLAVLRSVADLAEPATWPARAAALVQPSVVVAPAVETVRGRAAAAAALLLPALARVAALATVAEAAVRRVYVDRPSAVAARAALAEAVAAEVDRLSSLTPQPFATISRLVVLRDAAVAALTRRATTLAPVVTIAAPTALPALVWAWRLYRDPTRAPEIAARNRLSHPGFVPTRFEALAR